MIVMDNVSLILKSQPFIAGDENGNSNVSIYISSSWVCWLAYEDLSLSLPKNIFIRSIYRSFDYY